MSHDLNINGRTETVEAVADMPLLWVLRDVLGLTGTKFGCGQGLCGACTVHLEGRAIRSCVTPIGSIGARRITTIEGIAEQPLGAAVQRAWLALNVPQCGYCQAGQIMAATAFLRNVAHPNDEQIDDAMSGNLCRCGTYSRIRAAIHKAAQALGEKT